MEYLGTINRQFAIIADNHEEALKKLLAGDGTVIATFNLSVQPKPQPPQAQFIGGTAQPLRPPGS